MTTLEKPLIRSQARTLWRTIAVVEQGLLERPPNR